MGEDCKLCSHKDTPLFSLYELTYIDLDKRGMDTNEDLPAAKRTKTGIQMIFLVSDFFWLFIERLVRYFY